MQFGNEEYLYLILLLPLVMHFFIRRLKLSHKQMLLHIDPNCLKTIIFSSPHMRAKRHFILLLCFLFLLISLARPQLLTKINQQVETEGSEIILIADVSRSMLVEDMGTRSLSRLTVMKKELQKLVELLKGQRIGLIAFAGSALLIAPLTLDHTLVKLYLNSLSYETLPIQGTDFSTAFYTAWQAIRRGGTRDPTAPKVLIVASDGEDNENNAVETAMELSKEANIRIFTMGFGSSEGGLIPTYDPSGNKKGYKKDQNGELVHSYFDPGTLKKIANVTEGAFYSVSMGDNSVKKIYSQIQSLKKGSISQTTQGAYIELYQYFLIVSFLFGGAYLFRKDTKKQNKTLTRNLTAHINNMKEK